MYLQFPPKMNDICAVKVFSFCTGNGTFPIKFFPVSLLEYVLNRQLHEWEKPSDNLKKRRAFLKDGQTTNPCHSQHDVSFVIRTFPSFNLFRSWLCFALCIFSQ